MKTKMTKKKVTKKVETPHTGLYNASIKIFGRIYVSAGDTLKECIENLKVGKVGGVCVMIVTHGDVKKEKILNGGQLFRLFSSSRVMKEMAMKNVLNLFGDI